jgi:hypothetical protein
MQQGKESSKSSTNYGKLCRNFLQLWGKMYTLINRSFTHYYDKGEEL